VANFAERCDLLQLKAALTECLEEVAEALLGPPNPATRGRKEWRWGSKYSAALVVRGPKRGAFKSHETQRGGGVIDFIMHARGCSFREAVEWARRWLGLGDEPAAPVDATVLRERARKKAAARIEAEADERKRIAYARRLWNEASAIDGTVAEQYLTYTRKIPRPAAGWPNAVRWHAPSCSLIVAATDVDGAVLAVQRVFLKLDAQKIDKVEAEARNLPPNAKQTNGLLRGAVMWLPGAGDGPLLLAEGPETGLSAWAATQHETWIAFGGLANISPPAGRTIVVCRDDDPAWSPADRALRKTLAAWQAAGCVVAVATPWHERRGDKSDLNDVLQAGGVDAVHARIVAALAPGAPPRRRKDVGAARRDVTTAMDAFFAAAVASDEPPVHAVKIDTAAGKSRASRRGAAGMLALMRQRGDLRNMVIAVDTLQLGDEAAVAFESEPAARASGLTAALLRGREAADPDAPGQTMCRDLERVRDAMDAGEAVQAACCTSKSGTCPFFSTCGYQAQQRQTADVYFVAHERLFTEKPAVVGDLAALIVDESPVAAGMEGESGRPITLAVDALRADDALPGLDGQRLRYLRRLILAPLDAHADGPVQRAALRPGGMTADGAAEARTLEWRRKIDAKMHPAMTVSERKAAVRAAAGNRTIRRLAMFWRAIEALMADDGPAASGWAALAREDTKNGPTRVLHLKGRRPIRKGWQVPTLLIDATLNLDLVRPMWPSVQLVADVAVETPHQRIWQVTDRSYSKQYLELTDDLSKDERRIRTRHLRALHATIAAVGRSYAPGRVLAVVQKSIEESLLGLGMLSSNVVTAHHNATRGRDCWGDVAAQVIVGRCAPPPQAVERMAEALTGRAVVPLEGWYPKVATVREMAAGTTQATEADRHPDPVCEAIRWQVCEGELVQIVGRARGVNRSEADPVDVILMTDVVLPLPLAGTLRAADLTPSPADLMLAAGGLAFESATDAATAYPQLWKSQKTATSAMAAARARLDDSPYMDSLIREIIQPPDGFRGCAQVDYQRAGAGCRPASAWFDSALVPDVAAWLMAKLGPLAWCRLQPAVITAHATLGLPRASATPITWHPPGRLRSKTGRTPGKPFPRLHRPRTILVRTQPMTAPP
jgi:putative DNA primase/helicase